jgi:hypothetical protein
MKKIFSLKSLMPLIISGMSVNGFTQVNGDFQTKISGNWNDYTSWNVYNGTTWIPATLGQIPTMSTNVFVQPGQTINVDNANAVCKDLNVNGDNSSKVTFSATTGILNVTGNMLLFSTSHNCFGTWAAGAKIVFSGNQNQSFTNLSTNAVFLNVEVNKSARTLSLSSNILSIDGTLTLTSGILNIGANGSLVLNGPLVATSGILDGTTTSDISITGTSGGSVLLPVSANISLKNITVSGTRILIMDGLHNISLNGTFTIASGATYDNGGESQITNSGGSIVINGKFINRDKDDFCGSNGAVTQSFNPSLSPGCTIEFALGNNQFFTARNDFKNITFSGSGTKTPSSTFTPTGTLSITGAAIVDASNHNIGDGSTLTDFNMIGGRLIIGTTGTQPMMGSFLGFDALSFAPSVKTYNPGNNTYTGIGSTNIAFDATLGGYMTFIRGDRTATSVISAVTGTTLRTEGKLFTGDQPAINLIPGKFIPVNNPYASALDLRNISRSNSIFYYVWDPNRGGAYGFGGFTTLSWDGSMDYDVVPANAGSYGATNNYIAGGQAFFVSGSGSVQITENAKTAATFTSLPFTPAGIPSQKLRSNLYSVNADGSSFLADGVLCSFADNYSNNVDEMDAKKMMNFSENLSVKKEGLDLVVERRPALFKQDTIFFNLAGLQKRQYRFEFIASQLSRPGLEAFLEDSYLKTRTLLNLIDTDRVDFVIDNNAASAEPGRFRIVFNAAGASLPVTFTNVKAYPENETIAVQWSVENESGIKNYLVEKSTDGVRFTPVVVITAHNYQVSSNYNWIDLQPAMGYNYYRIKSTGTGGEIQYSKIVKVWYGTGKKGITVYPNPSPDGIIHLHFNNQPEGKYCLQLMNALGQVIQPRVIQHTGRGNTETISLDEDTPHGLYRLHIIPPDNTEQDIDIIY